MVNNIKSIYDLCDLADGNTIPWVGFGTYQLHDQSIIEFAINHGYRHIDTASIYGNEQIAGNAIKACGINRNEIFVTTKLWNDDHGFGKVTPALQKSLNRLGLDYVDLYLIHWPVPSLRKESWNELIKCKQNGLIKSIGVSNYTISHLKELFNYSNQLPVINQVEFSPFLYQLELLKFCTKHNIIIQAYSPLTKGVKINDPLLVELAKKYNKTSAQIILKWILDLGVIILPKTQHKNRIVENASLFDFQISKDDHFKIGNSLDCGYRTSWNPTNED